MLVKIGLPSTIRPARKVVPPISVQMMLVCPSIFPSVSAPVTPPLRTEPTLAMALSAACFTDITPPDPCMIRRGPRKCFSLRLPSSDCRYPCRMGATWAVIMVVELLANSLMRGLISLESAT